MASNEEGRRHSPAANDLQDFKRRFKAIADESWDHGVKSCVLFMVVDPLGNTWNWDLVRRISNIQLLGVLEWARHRLQWPESERAATSRTSRDGSFPEYDEVSKNFLGLCKEANSYGIQTIVLITAEDALTDSFLSSSLSAGMAAPVAIGLIEITKTNLLFDDLQDA